MKKVVLLFLILVLSLTVVSCGNDENAPEIANGVDGKSAYELAVEKGYEGTVEEWLASLVGEVGAPGKDGANGQSAYELAVKNGYTGSENEWIASLVGADGKDHYAVLKVSLTINKESDSYLDLAASVENGYKKYYSQV
jgi:hypothetical protein